MDALIGAGQSRGTTAGAHIVVVDADPTLIQSVTEQLEGCDFRVSSAPCGEQGLTQARSLHPDAILLGRGLPDLEPGEFLHRLRDDEATRTLPIMLLAGRSEDGEPVKGLHELVDDYVTPPFGIQSFGERVAHLLQRCRRQTARIEAEKLKTLREVIASVSHGVNNPLAAILMSAEALVLSHAEVGDVVKKSRVIQENVQRIRGTLQRLERVRVLASTPYVAGDWILDLSREEEQG